jgi:hypothetical protein
MHTRVRHVILPDQLVLGIRIHMVLVAVESLAVLLGPARVLVFPLTIRDRDCIANLCDVNAYENLDTSPWLVLLR